MSEPRFTPGPWLSDGLVCYALTKHSNGGNANRFMAVFQSARQDHEAGWEELKANTVLAAAAPDLYHALNSMVQHFGPMAGDTDDKDLADTEEYMVGRALKALAKARGEQT